MNLLERGVDAIDPRLSVKMRLIKKRMQHDPICDVIRQFVAPGQLVADIGANRGTYTWLMSRIVGVTGRVHSFEPYPGNVERLTKLSKSRRNIAVHPVALSDSAGAATLHVPMYRDRQVDALASLRSSVNVSVIPIQVDKCTLDELIQPNEQKLSFIKCDVEGHEDAVVNGAWRTITQNRPVMVTEIEQRHRAAPVADLVERLVGVGYDCFFLDMNGMQPYVEFDIERHQLHFVTTDFVPCSMPQGYVGNFVFVPRRGS